MSTSAVTLCNVALKLLGADSLTSFDEGTDLAESCNTIYPSTVRALQASHPWRFTLTKLQLSRLAEPPLNEWRHAHALPPGMLILRQLFASGAVGQPPLTAYELFDGRAYSDQPELWADYQVERDPAIWPPYFTTLAEYALAAALALAVTESTERADYFRRLAFGTPQDAGNGGLMRDARRLDSTQQPAQALHDFPLIAARLGSFARGRA